MRSPRLCLSVHFSWFPDGDDGRGGEPKTRGDEQNYRNARGLGKPYPLNFQRPDPGSVGHPAADEN
jgi:hypothetical protein